MAINGILGVSENQVEGTRACERKNSPTGFETDLSWVESPHFTLLLKIQVFRFQMYEIRLILIRLTIYAII